KDYTFLAGLLEMMAKDSKQYQQGCVDLAIAYFDAGNIYAANLFASKLGQDSVGIATAIRDEYQRQLLDIVIGYVCAGKLDAAHQWTEKLGKNNELATQAQGYLDAGDAIAKARQGQLGTQPKFNFVNKPGDNEMEWSGLEEVYRIFNSPSEEQKSFLEEEDIYSHGVYLLMISDALYAVGRVEEAIALLKMYVEEEGDDSEYILYSKLLEILELSHAEEEDVLHCLKNMAFTEQGKKDLGLVMRVAKLCKKRNEMEDADLWFRKALRLDKKSIDAIAALKEIYVTSKDYKRADKFNEKLLLCCSIDSTEYAAATRYKQMRIAQKAGLEKLREWQELPKREGKVEVPTEAIDEMLSVLQAAFGLDL
ncbi:tetratricopeptide repeat protein, partial [Thermoproteota archaeon]